MNIYFLLKCILKLYKWIVLLKYRMPLLYYWSDAIQHTESCNVYLHFLHIFRHNLSVCEKYLSWMFLQYLKSLLYLKCPLSSTINAPASSYDTDDLRCFFFLVQYSAATNMIVIDQISSGWSLKPHFQK